jgi:hypothetical protein
VIAKSRRHTSECCSTTDFQPANKSSVRRSPSLSLSFPSMPNGRCLR